tara:strand:+ start:7915 stop:8070 length:156 start_codon:yes stop_codon:yes gene_type:complete
MRTEQMRLWGKGRSRKQGRSADDVMNAMARNVGQPKSTPGVGGGQLFVIEP